MEPGLFFLYILPRRCESAKDGHGAVNGRRSEPTKSAEHSVIAIGRNIRPSRPSRSEDWHINGDDNRHPEHDGPRATSRGSIAKSFLCDPLVAMRKPPHRVFDHDDRPIDDHSEIECAQAHQVGRHACTSPFQRKPNSIESGMIATTMKAARKSPRKQREGPADQNPGLQKIAGDGMNGSRYNVRLVIERNQPDSVQAVSNGQSALSPARSPACRFRP